MMEHPGFFERAGPFSLSHVAAAVAAELAPGIDGTMLITDVRPLDEAAGGQLSFLDNRKYLPQLEGTKAAACLVQSAFVGRVPAGTAALISKSPYRSFAQSLMLFYPSAGRPKAAETRAGEPLVHPTARIEDGAKIEAGAIVGREAWIGRDTIIAAGAVVGYRVTVGRGGYVGPCASLQHCMIGDRVIIHGGVRIGQDGFGFAMGPAGHLKVPQIGRVVIQDDVEIGANTSVDRGALKDTIIGQGTKIDNLVQIGHNVVIGRHCVIVAQVGIAGSSTLEDFVVIGGQGGIAGHLRVGQGSQIAGASHVTGDVKPGARLVGTPAVPLREWTAERMALRKLAGGKTDVSSGGNAS
jgi:UDP-3-O-[3-hydroxymyristoyl] glucosamine N-acyltransferase